MQLLRSEQKEEKQTSTHQKNLLQNTNFRSTIMVLVKNVSDCYHMVTGLRVTSCCMGGIVPEQIELHLPIRLCYLLITLHVDKAEKRIE